MPAYVVVDLDGAGDELDRLARGPGPVTIGKWEGALMVAYAATEARVHVITGELLASGHPSSSFDLTSWTGEISFARDPGVFELARDDQPTRHHAGGHYFFDPAGPLFEYEVRQAFWDWITDGRGGHAPSGGLGPWSGGDD
jgi:hypothetical protein